MPMTVLNTIVAETLKQFKKDVEASIDKGEKKEIAMEAFRRSLIRSGKKETQGLKIRKLGPGPGMVTILGKKW